MKNDEKDALIIREFCEVEQYMFALLYEETYDSKNIRSATEAGKANLIATLRTQNFFPIGILAEKIAEVVINIYTSENDQSVELFFNDHDILTKKQKTKTVDDFEDELSGIDDFEDELSGIDDFEDELSGVDDFEDELSESDDLRKEQMNFPAVDENIYINDVAYPGIAASDPVLSDPLTPQ